MRPLVATVDLSAIRHNYAVAKRCAPGRQAFAVVKANAYGHGAREVVSALHDEADGFAVACLEEAAEVRALHADARILLLEGCFEPSEYLIAAQLRLDVAVQGPEQAHALLETQLPSALNVWLKLDSGMHRLGFSASAIRDWHPRLKQAKQVAELNLMSHFACADVRGDSLNEDQVECFLGLLDLDFDQRSLANSAAVLTIPAAHMDWVRPGIMLYGATPFADISAVELGLRPALNLEAQLIAVRDVPVGESVGYGARWVAQRPSRIGTVSCGYADGYPRHAPSGTPVLLGGKRVPLAGRVSMDMLAVDLTDLPSASVGESVELWGAHLPVDEVAAHAGTIGYELLTKITARVPRRYRN
ncbi:alanine racemase [Pseudomonas sp. ZM23]|uniref:Alanine racemase n=1 Tax=Pseudomonas triclosanedens TaxID=2961893 RepID=A0ABY6ZWY3_9PSED|nr:alanine racemase [Pseudomonas triclosanedens]MCP8465171.1 alanine racemase [Pseudomonas triclosanedens]MCP8470889.1 alanine racemase [Pseudomonas triclosanedens]MCP8476471.1 alanine racemase [Pseudomonas triclosanedens]WAI49072.1 alanine racemase [Pseudomonas triclosanedens]